MTGQEERDVLFARLFGLNTVIQSGLLVRQSSLTASASTSIFAANLSGYKETVSQLLSLGEKKSWLRESAWWTAILAVSTLDKSDVSWKREAINATVDTVFADNRLWTSEKVAMALKLQASYPTLNWRKLLSPTFKSPELLSIGNLTTLAKILKVCGLLCCKLGVDRHCIVQESNLDEDEGTDAAKSAFGNWKPQVHFAWDIILDQLLFDRTPSETTKLSFQEFFRVVVDGKTFHTIYIDLASSAILSRRITLLFDIISGKKVLGFSSVPESSS